MTPLAGYGDIVDLSEANGPVDFVQVRNSGVVGVILRATKGLVTLPSDVDRRLYEYANGARAAGLPFWLYGLGFARHGRAQDADEQARDLADKARELGAERLIWADWEREEREKGDEHVTEPEFIEAIRAWFAGANGAGYEGGLYYGPGWWALSRARLAATDLAHVKRWCSDFEASRPIGQPLAVGPWTTPPAMHQYAGSKTPTGRAGACPGVSGACDRSRLLVPIGAIRA